MSTAGKSGRDSSSSTSSSRRAISPGKFGFGGGGHVTSRECVCLSFAHDSGITSRFSACGRYTASSAFAAEKHVFDHRQQRPHPYCESERERDRIRYEARAAEAIERAANKQRCGR